MQPEVQQNWCENLVPKPKPKRIMISVSEEDYNYCVSHFIKISPICAEALTQYIKWQKQRLIDLKKEIPANVDKMQL